ncbi:hypothetical protein [Castellaniella sp. S9]|nr:hypothetical protein [Castellaniella sp. S9]
MEQNTPSNTPPFNQKKGELQQKPDPKSSPQEPAEQEKGDRTAKK